MDFREEMNAFRREMARKQAESERRVSEFFSQRRGLVGHRQNPRLAMTVPDANATYPAEGSGANTFPIVFLSGGFVPAAGAQVPSYTPHDEVRQTYVLAISGAYIPVGTVIQTWQDVGVDPGSPGNWWTPWDADSDSMILRFRLTADLALGSHAAAKILTWNGSAWVVSDLTITVYDWFNTVPVALRTGMFRGWIDYEGWARFRQPAEDENDHDKYDIVWMERKADWVTFELLEEIQNQDEPFEAEYEITIGSAGHGFSRGRDPNRVENKIDVYDVTGTFFGAPIGAIGIAKYNDRNDHYEIIRCQMPQVRGTGTLTSDMCGQDAEFTWDGGFITGEFMVSPDPPPTTATNDCEHYGQAGDTVFIELDLATKEWRVYDVTKKVISAMPIDIYWDDDAKCIKKVTREVAVESCKNPNEPENLLCFDPCE